jgi:hypothetical protein
MTGVSGNAWEKHTRNQHWFRGTSQIGSQPARAFSRKGSIFMKQAVRISPAQRRLVALVAEAGDCAEFWPVVNDWAKETAGALALRNINRTVATLERLELLTVDDDGIFRLTEAGKAVAS